MRILLIGEYSSLHRYLKQGLKKVDPTLEVTLAASCDGWKKISGADIEFNKLSPDSSGSIFDKYKAYVIEPGHQINELTNYDIIQFINPMIFQQFINPLYIYKLIKNNKHVSLVSAGYDCALVKAYNEHMFPYYIFDYNKWLLKWYKGVSVLAQSNRFSNRIVTKSAECIIPSLYEYSVGYQGSSKLTKVVPFPIELDELEYHENNVTDKIVFFHGLNRESEKGTPFIKEALEKLKNIYPDKVEVIMKGHMPFSEYIDVMKRANVVIDQCCSLGYGINACIAMGQGKVVMSGADQKTIQAFQIKNCPIIPITPSVDDIFRKCEKIVMHPNTVGKIGLESRKYVEEVHDNRKIAEEYLSIWKEIL